MDAAGKSWLLAYNQISHGVVLSLVGLTVLALLVISARDQAATDERTQPWPSRILRWIGHHPVVTLVFAGYTVAMVQAAPHAISALPSATPRMTL